MFASNLYEILSQTHFHKVSLLKVYQITMAGNHQNVALIGASGNLGSKTLDALVKQGKNNVTVITRPTSTIKYPPRVQVKKGEYKDAAFLESALHGQDVLVIMLGFGGLPDQDAIIQAAAKAGVRYLLPTEYGAPSGNEKQIKAVELIKIKRDVHDQIEQLGMKWVGVVTNPWIDYVGDAMSCTFDHCC